MGWMCEPYWSAPFPLVLLAIIVFFILGIVCGHFMTFFSAYDWESKYKQWKKDKGYDD